MTTSATRREHDLWLLENLVPGTAVNNLSVVFDVEGTLREHALQRAVHAVVGKHTALRTVFRVGDEGLEKEVRHVEVPVEVLRADAPCVSEEELRRYIAQPFALDGGPLLRVALFRGTAADTVCLATHHLVFDAISGGTVLEELVAAYEADAEWAEPSPESDEETPLPEAVPSAESLAFWKRHLDGYRADGLELWCDKQGEPPVTLAGEVHHHELSAEADAAITRMRRELRAPKAVALLTAYYVTLALHGAGPDLVVGVPASTRGTAAQRAVGYHVNMLPVRAGVDRRRSVREVAAEVRAGFFEALAHPDVPAETFLPRERQDRHGWRNTLFRHVFNYVPTDFRTTFTLAGDPAVQRLVENGTSKYDLEFFLSESAETTQLSVLYNSQVLRHDDVTALVARYDELLAALPELLDTPVGDISCWSVRDRIVLPATAGESAVETASSGVVGTTGSNEVVAATRRAAELYPTRTAVRTRDGDLSYAELWEAAQTGRTPSTTATAEAVRTLRALLANGDSPEEKMSRRVADAVGDLACHIGAEPGSGILWTVGPDTPDATAELFLALICQGTALDVQLDGVRPDVVHGTPARMWELLADAASLGGMKAVVSGEPLPPALAAPLLRQGAEVFSAYQPVGQPYWVAVRAVTTESEAVVPGGVPLAGAAAFVADADGTRLPIGLRGRLGIIVDGSAVVTDECAMWRSDGTLDVLGATPEARVQLALLEHSSVTTAAVVASPTSAGTGHDDDSLALVAYVTGDATVDSGDADGGDVLRDHCVATLPHSMVPDRIVRVEALPAHDRRIDYERLVADAASSAESQLGGQDDQSAEDALTESLVRLWSTFLECSALDADANFFNEGGHSLLGAQLIQRVKKLTGAGLRLADLFTYPTPREFGKLLSGPEHGISAPLA